MNCHSFFTRAARAIVLLMLSSAAPVNAQARGYTVDSTGDGGNVGSSDFCNDGTGHCTLRAALEAANAHRGTDEIRFSIPVSDPGYNGLFWTINLTRALPDVSDSIGIIGPGANRLTVRRDTGGGYRIFNVTTTGTVTFSGLTINDGSADSGTFAGGGIQNLLGGTVNVTNCTLSGNFAFAGGGGDINNGGSISNNSTGSVNVTNSTLSNNHASHNGGGIANLSTGTVNVTNSTISGNSAGGGAGGGIANRFSSGTLTVTNSTVRNNQALNHGGGIHTNGTLNVTNSTISGNRATSSSAAGGGIGIEGNGIVNISNSTISDNSCESGRGGGISKIGFGAVHVRSSIIAGNTAGTDSPDVRGAYRPSGFNLIGNNEGAEGSFPMGNPNVNNDLVGAVAAPVDPKLDPAGLQDNGGPTKTIALLSNSPAIDAGTSVGLSGPLATDQRGAAFPRTIELPFAINAVGGDGTDIGAFEFPKLKMDVVAKLPNGHILLQGVGIPNRLHTIHASRNLGPDPTSFIPIGTPTADETGALQYDDAAALVLEKRFYRLTFP